MTALERSASAWLAQREPQESIATLVPLDAMGLVATIEYWDARQALLGALAKPKDAALARDTLSWHLKRLGTTRLLGFLDERVPAAGTGFLALTACPSWPQDAWEVVEAESRLRSERDELIESCLSKAGLWNEVKNRLGDPGRALSGGQQQRLCIARSLAVSPQVLLMDEPCSALDPTSTRRIEQTISEISETVTVVIVTHNMQQAQRVSHRCAFFLAAENEPGRIIEEGPTKDIFTNPRDSRTNDYVNGRFG
jgi:ABC-type dipeptide/oligopeptide/nickel transport system ATPase subunit